MATQVLGFSLIEAAKRGMLYAHGETHLHPAGPGCAICAAGPLQGTVLAPHVAGHTYPELVGGCPRRVAYDVCGCPGHAPKDTSGPQHILLASAIAGGKHKLLTAVSAGIRAMYPAARTWVAAPVSPEQYVLPGAPDLLVSVQYGTVALFAEHIPAAEFARSTALVEEHAVRAVLLAHKFGATRAGILTFSLDSAAGNISEHQVEVTAQTVGKVRTRLHDAVHGRLDAQPSPLRCIRCHWEAVCEHSAA